MPRKARVEAADAIQQVIARGVADVDLFRDDDDRLAFVSNLARASELFEWRVHAYCLMDTHVHAVIETSEPTLGPGMQRLLGGYAFRFNRRHGRHGHLFGGRFTASLIDTESYAIQVCAYVVLNPVRAGIVPRSEDWRWSSYRATAGLVNAPPFLATWLVPEALHPELERAREQYRELVTEVALRPRAGQAEA